jgi:hypothetical protein
MSVWKDFGSAEDQQTFDIIPRGTIARVRMTIKPGGYNDPIKAGRAATPRSAIQARFISTANL